ncbi:MAG: aromatic ring-hydroxylating oxygenase subunit alpha, partial [Longimicrobiales bacterium]
MATFLKTTESYHPGARTLARDYLVSPEIFEEEQERIFRRGWLCIGRAADLPEPGSYRLIDVAGESIIVLRDRSDVPRAFYNTCRHRGARLLCEPAEGMLSGSIQCPYHAWTYALDGQLIGAPHMKDVEGFDRSDYPLHGAAIDMWEGFAFVNLGPAPQPLRESLGPLVGRFTRFNLPLLRRAMTIEYDVHANWKIVFQNYNECLHCPVIHPELNGRTPYDSGANDLVDGPFLGGSMELGAGFTSMTMSGNLCAVPV